MNTLSFPECCIAFNFFRVRPSSWVWRIILITLHRSGVIFCLNLFFF